MLDALFDRDGQTLTELLVVLSSLTRFGVMKHLGVLADASLVVTRKVGREKFHYLNPVPIRRLHDRWISKFAEPWARALTRAADAGKVWQAITDPSMTVGYYFGCAIESTWEPGSPYRYVVETGSPIGDIPDERAGQPAADLDGELHREQAVTANNLTWELLDQAERTADDDEDMVRCAYAAAYHWARAARRGPENEARASWLLSRVHAVLGRGEAALHHAQGCAAACAAGTLGDFDLAYAHESTARALACLGRLDEAAQALASARVVPIADPEDRAIVEGDLTAEPWFGLSLDGSVVTG